jgi:hypothetical protein
MATSSTSFKIKKVEHTGITVGEAVPRVEYDEANAHLDHKDRYSD